MTRCTFSTVF